MRTQTETSEPQGKPAAGRHNKAETKRKLQEHQDTLAALIPILAASDDDEDMEAHGHVVAAHRATGEALSCWQGGCG